MSTIFPRLDPQLILPKKIEAPTVVNAIEAIKQELVLKLTQTGIGNRLQAEVMAKLPDGSFIAKIADLPVHVDLPRNPAIGQKISLTISQIIPHPVFVLHESEQKTSLISPKTGLSKADTPFHDYVRQLGSGNPNPLPTNTLGEPHQNIDQTQALHAAGHQTGALTGALTGVKNAVLHDTSTVLPTSLATSEPTTELELSPAAKLISQVLKEQSGTQQFASIRVPQTLTRPHHLTANLASISTQFAYDIQQNVQKSGLFYESHLADWVDGKRKLADLRLEPQARLASTQVTTDETRLQSLSAKDHEQLSQLVNQQLNLIDHPRLHYEGLLAAGMPFQWIIETQDHATDQAAVTPEEPEKIWHSTLEVDLPELGKIAIAFTLNNNKLDLTLKGNKSDSIEKLNSRFNELASLMQASGTDIISYKSAYHELP